MDFKKVKNDLYETRGVQKTKEEAAKRIVAHMEVIKSRLSAEDVTRMTNAGVDVRTLLAFDTAEAAVSEEANVKLKEHTAEVVRQIMEYIEQNRIRSV